MNFKRIGWIILALVVVLSASVLAAEKDVMIGAFDVGPGGMPQVFNPFQATAGFNWLTKYFSRLVTYDKDFTELFGDLAESWDVSEDGKTWTFNLRKNVYWHDGVPFTAEDIRFTLELALTPEFAWRYLGQFQIIEGAAEFGRKETDHLTGVEVVNRNTIKITTTEPIAPFLDLLAWLLFIMPEHQLAHIPPAELLNHNWWKTKPVGTGPFVWDEYVPDQYLALVRNDEYFRGAPKLAKLINRYFMDDSAAILALERGEIDFTYIASDEVARLKNNPNLEIIEGPSHVANFVVFNHTIPALQDQRVRQAFYYAIDRDAIIETLYNGTAQKVNSIYHNPLYIPDDLNQYEYNPEKARQLLREAGWDRAKVGTLELLTYYTDQLSSDVMAAMQAYLADVGIDIVPRVVDVPTYNASFYAGDFVISYKGMGNGPDPDAIRPAYESTMTHPAGVNAGFINDPDLDEALNLGRVTVNELVRQAWYQQVSRIQNENVYNMYMWVGNRYGAVNKRVKDFIWTPAPAASRYYDFPELWYIGE